MTSFSDTLLLPDEILLLICQELGHERDFGTLFSCALASSISAETALRVMYQFHEQSLSFLQSDDFESRTRSVDIVTRAAEQNHSFRKWTILWRSIILSSLDGSTTYRPYCRYIRTLDFRNLSNMLDDYKFIGPVSKAFFADGLEAFHFPKREGKRLAVDAFATVNAVGEAVTVKTSLLEEIAGHLSPGFLPRWIERSPKLQSMVLWKGEALVNGAGEAIAKKCEYFRNLTISYWQTPEADRDFATFLDELHPDTLGSFELINHNNISKLSFTALGRHKTLHELKLNNLDMDAMSSLNQLKGCTELRTLLLEDNLGSTQLETLHNDVFLEVVEWLSSCKDLRDLTLKKFYDGPTILSHVFQTSNLQLVKLSIEGYVVRQPNAKLFHAALGDQQSLESVWLKGDGENTHPDDLQVMVEALCRLRSLRKLVLQEVSDEFSDEHIVNLGLSLPLLEDLTTSGGEVTDDVLPVLGSLKFLKDLTLYALTQFSAEALLDFLSNLDPATQKGFSLSLLAFDPEYDLTEKHQEIIREFIRANLGGKFEYLTWREAESSDSEDD